jgi:hypothetical protein
MGDSREGAEELTGVLLAVEPGPVYVISLDHGAVLRVRLPAGDEHRWPPPRERK